MNCLENPFASTGTSSNLAMNSFERVNFEINESYELVSRPFQTYAYPPLSSPAIVKKFENTRSSERVAWNKESLLLLPFSSRLFLIFLGLRSAERSFSIFITSYREL